MIGIPVIQELADRKSGPRFYLRPIWNEIQLTDLNSECTADSGNDEYHDSTPWKVEPEKTE